MIPVESRWDDCSGRDIGALACLLMSVAQASVACRSKRRVVRVTWCRKNVDLRERMQPQDVQEAQSLGELVTCRGY